MEDRIFEMELPVDKNSREFDFALLQELKTLKDIPVNKFDALMKKIMKKKSSCKLWWDNKTTICQALIVKFRISRFHQVKHLLQEL